ncbi:helix-turn-helix transcriptional regulator [Methylobacterium sp. A54F]
MGAYVDAAELSRLIEAIYDCAIDPALWPSTLEQIAEAVDSPAATLNVIDFVTGAERTLVYAGISEAYQTLYRERYHCTNLFLHGMMLRPIDEPTTSDELVDEAELLSSRVYREWAAPQGFRHVMLTALIRNQARLAFLGVTRGFAPGRYGARDKECMTLLAPHVRRAITIADLIEHKSLERSRFGDVVDALATAILILDGTGRLAHANPAGKALLEAGDLLVQRNGVVEALDAASGSLRLTRNAGTQGESHAITLRRGGGDTAIVTTLALRSSRRGAIAADPEHVAVFVQDGASPNIIETLGRTFGLTGAELRVLLGLVEGATTQDLAARYGIAASTVRTHLKSLFAKTGTNRQKDLVALLFAVPPIRTNPEPIAGSPTS